jgi:hypothetical protein
LFRFPTTAEQFRVYAGHRELMGYGLQTCALFVSSHGRCLAYDTLRQRFHTFVDKAGIRARQKCNKPTVHSDTLSSYRGCAVGTKRV